jgi:type I restriction enzyme R subunit
LEKLFVYLRYLSPKLPRRKGVEAYDFDDDVRLEYYRLQKISEGAITLAKSYALPLDGPTELGVGMVREPEVALRTLIDRLNDRFGTDFNPADQLFFDQMVATAIADEEIIEAAAANPKDKFKLIFEKLLRTLFSERIDQNEEIFARYMNDGVFHEIVTSWLADTAYDDLRKGNHPNE